MKTDYTKLTSEELITKLQEKDTDLEAVATAGVKLEDGKAVLPEAKPTGDPKPAEGAGDPKPAEGAGDPKPAEGAGDPKPVEATAQLKEVETKMVTLTEKYDVMAKDIRKRTMDAEVSVSLSELKAAGHTPATLEKFQLAICGEENATVVKLSDAEDGVDTLKLSIESAKKFLELIPEELRVDLSENAQGSGAVPIGESAVKKHDEIIEKATKLSEGDHTKFVANLTELVDQNEYAVPTAR